MAKRRKRAALHPGVDASKAGQKWKTPVPHAWGYEGPPEDEPQDLPAEQELNFDDDESK
jgi:hypothetical protein